MITNYHRSFIEIEGFNFPCRVKYEGHGDELHIHDIEVQGQDKEWIGMPYLPEVDEIFKQEIWDNE